MENMASSPNDYIEIEDAIPSSEKEARLTNIAKLKAIIDKNKYFSSREKEGLLTKFANLTVQDQIRSLSSFERRNINQRWSPEVFYLYPPELRTVPEGVFLESNRTEKKTTLKNMETELEKRFTEKLLHSTLSKYFAEPDKKNTIERFKASDLKKRIAMFNAVDSWLQFEADGYGEFEKRLASLSRYGRRATKKAQIFLEKFLKTNGVDRMKIFEEVEMAIIEAKEERKLGGLYAEALAHKRKNKVISKTTEIAYNRWFRRLPIEQKQTALDEFEEHMGTRVDLLIKFEKDIDPNLQKAEEAKGKDGFYGLGNHGRMARYNELLEKQGSSATPKITDKTQEERSSKIGKKNESMLDRKPSEDKITAAIAATIHDSRNTLIDIEMVKLYAEAAKNRERRNKSNEFGKNDRPEEQDRLEKALKKRAKVLDDKGENVVGILTLDPQHIKEIPDVNRHTHLRTAATLQGSKTARESNTNVGIIREGRTVSGEEASKIVAAMTVQTQQEVARMAIQKLQRDGEKITKELAEKITSKIANDKAMHPDLPKAA